MANLKKSREQKRETAFIGERKKLGSVLLSCHWLDCCWARRNPSSLVCKLSFFQLENEKYASYGEWEPPQGYQTPF